MRRKLSFLYYQNITIMGKYFTWLRANCYKVALIAVTIVLIYGFMWCWKIIPALWWWQFLLVIVTLFLEDCALFAACEHLLKWWKGNPKLYNSELGGITWCYIIGFLTLAIMAVCFVWGDFWLVIGTGVLAFILFWAAMVIVMLTHNSMFGELG